MNPYNYQEPVKNASELVDREDSRDELEYYLKEASSGNFFNIAITGERGIGKRSLKNVGQESAKDLGIMPVDVPVGQMNTVDELEFYKGLFEIILSQAIEQGYLEESWLDKFRGAIAGNEEEISIGYSSTYFRIKSGSGGAADLPRKQIIEDFKEIYEKVDAPAIALFFDKADLLTENSLLFRKFHSILNNSDGFFMILSGNKLNESLPNEIAPLRQSFATIQLSEFEEQQYTKEFLLQPLSDSERSDFDQERIEDIHRITGGHPYEISLVAHHMYRKYQLGSDAITIDSEVLAEVAKSIETDRVSEQGGILDKIKQLSDEQLRLLVYLLEIPRASKEWLVRYSLLKDISEITREVLESEKQYRRRLVDQLLEIDLINQDEDGIGFAGETFDRLYLKYYAADQDELDLANFHPDRSRSPRQAVYNEIIRQGFENSEQNYRFITKFDFIREYVPEKGEERMVQQQIIHKTGEITVESGEWETILEWKVGEFYEESEDSIWFRCNMSWVPTGFVTKVIVSDDESDPKEHLQDKIRELSTKLDILDYRFILEDEMTIFKRSQNAFENNDLDESEQLLRDALDVYPLFYPAWRNLGLIHSRRGQSESARVYYKMGLTLGGRNTDIAELLADAYRSDNLYSKAIEVLEESITEKSRQTGSTLLEICNIQLESGDVEGAIETFNRYLNSA